jgi:energy-coupling factor transport system ATP-binding protein
MEPAVLVFDEPTANLDPVGTQDVFALLAAQKAQGRHTIILIEHKLDELMRLIDRVIVLGNQGNLLADGAPRQVFRDQAGLLQMHGVWTPQVCMLAHRLGPSQLELEPFPITLEEMEAALRDKVIGRKDDFLSLSDQALLPDPPAAAPAIEVRNLSFSYGPNRALADISLQAPHGDFLAIVGANGAGKTTLAQHFIGILTPPPATVFVNGQDVSQISGRELARQVGYVFQNPEHQFITDSVFDEVAYGLRVMGLAGSEIETRTIQLLDMFGLVYYAKANPFTLSHGEKRRLSVATMLAMGQRILILDEPTFGQDQRNAEALLSLLVGLHHKGCTVIVITHDMTLVAEYARRVAVMAAGQLLFHGVPHALFAQPELLAQARLTLPPLARLASRLAEYQPQLRECITLAEFSRLEIRNAEIGALANRSEK